MAERHLGPEQLREIREMLESVLQYLDKAELHLAAIHVDMALTALSKEQTCWSKGFVGNDVH